MYCTLNPELWVGVVTRRHVAATSVGPEGGDAVPGATDAIGFELHAARREGMPSSCSDASQTTRHDGQLAGSEAV